MQLALATSSRFRRGSSEHRRASTARPRSGQRSLNRALFDLLICSISCYSGAGQVPTQLPAMEVIVPVSARRLALGLLLAAPLAGSAILGAGPAAAQSCDPAYTNYCVPPVSEVGDLDCQYFYDQGIYGIVLADPANDPHGLDGWNYVDDGYGCEGS